MIMTVNTRGSGARIIGRNGTFELNEIQIHIDDNGDLSIEGAGKRGYLINGGFIYVSVGTMIDLCTRFLEEMGYDIRPSNLWIENVEAENECRHI